MRAVTVAEPGGPEVLRLSEVADPVAGPGEVLIRVVAAGLNGADLSQRRGFYPPPAGAPAPSPPSAPTSTAGRSAIGCARCSRAAATPSS
jgi:NADPH:quinone reductase-like Zn-dependent oxidoreductase